MTLTKELHGKVDNEELLAVAMAEGMMLTILWEREQMRKYRDSLFPVQSMPEGSSLPYYLEYLERKEGDVG